MEPALDPTLIILLVLVGGFVTYIYKTRGRREKRLEERAAAHSQAQAQFATERSQSQVKAQALAMTQWREAFVLANPGQPVPAPPAMVFPAQPMSEHTNTLAILALIFGVLGGYLAIVFGHIALSQIKRTG